MERSRSPSERRDAATVQPVEQVYPIGAESKRPEALLFSTLLFRL